MYRLSSIILILFGILPILAQNPHGDELKINCNQCHNPAGWEIDNNYIRFDHSKTDFNLEGAHDKTDCKLCHTDLVLSNVPNQCASCHNDVHSMSVGNDCVQCHTSDTWLIDNIPELHEENGFPLIGSHSGLSCVDCHDSETNLRFDRIGNDCISCHQDDYLATQSPNHTDLGFSTDCLECHDPLGTGWDSDNIDHDFFPLTLGHDIDDCTQCHITDNYADASPECVSCHQTDYDTAQDPDHDGSGFSTNCVACHTTNPGWSPADFGNHDFFPLTLGHDIENCNQCHTTGNYSDASPECVSCHQENYDASVNPDHQTLNLTTDCVVCHTTTPEWMPASFDNHNDYYELNGAHALIANECATCHNGDYNNTPNTCVGCHLDEYNSTTDPNHSNEQFSTDCTICHTEDAWEPSTLNHDFFPLTAGHDGLDCTECHTTGNYTDASPECVSCHQTDYDNTSDPNHTDAGFSTDCASCHTTNPGWTPADVDHDFFPLTLGHDNLDCTQCHITGNYSDASPDCIACHQEDYNNSSDPNHSSAQFPTDCVQCHTTNPSWTPVTWNHNDFYPLNGAHVAIANDCVVCHNGDYVNTPNTCVGCHQTDFDGTVNPNHVDAGFSSDCASCHTEDAWEPATFDHDLFPLTLGHENLDCTQCHTTGNYTDADSDCVTCHQTDFDNTNDPNHSAAQFPTDCVQCHTTNPGWTPTTWDHDAQYFPIYSGKHDGEWNECIDCHNNTNDYSVYNCLNCHEHNDQNQVDNDHDHPDEPEFDGYVYESTACVSCHPNP